MWSDVLQRPIGKHWNILESYTKQDSVNFKGIFSARKAAGVVTAVVRFVMGISAFHLPKCHLLVAFEQCLYEICPNIFGQDYTSFLYNT
jgi:hypothetical protein